MRVLGIYREEIYSNHAVEADHAILDAALESFKEVLGSDLEIIKEYPHRLWAHEDVEDRRFDLVLTMAQGDRALDWTARAEKKGSLVLNSTQSIKNCFRSSLAHKLEGNEFGHPRSQVLDPKACLDRLPFDSRHGYWIKRGDFHALDDDDVQFARDLEGVNRVLRHAHSRGVGSLLLQEHIPGRIFKFYGVRGKYFNYRPMEGPFRDEPSFREEVPLNAEALKNLAFEAATQLELDFFGGDCVVTRAGTLHLIDVNDWPSFRTCREPAAKAMAEYLVEKLGRTP